jgi:hypothetical protein
MKFVELFEGTTPKLPGAVSGIKVMSMDQFLAQSNDEPDEEQIDEMSSEELDKMSPEQLVRYANDARNNKIKNVDPKSIDQAYGKSMSIMFPDRKKSEHNKQQGVAEGTTVTRIDSNPITDFGSSLKAYKHTDDWSQSGVDTGDDSYWKNKNLKTNTTKGLFAGDPKRTALYATGNAHETRYVEFTQNGQPIVYFDRKDLPAMRSRKTYLTVFDASDFRQLPTGEWFSENPSKPIKQVPIGDPFKYIASQGWIVRITDDLDKVFKQVKNMHKAGKIAQYGAEGMNESKQGVAEATKLPAQTRELKGQELDDYLDRIRNREKGKTDKYKLPYIHRSSVVKYYNEEGKRYNTDQIKEALGVRPKKLLKQNEKMKHSNGELEQFFNIGFAALVGIALDEGTNELIVVNTCPGAGSCKIDCFAMKGGKVQFEGPWLSDGRILTFLLNDPDGFFNKLSAEITKEEKLAQKGGYNLTIRWHDAGDFFSPEYQDLAFKLAASHPDVKFYAYTKIADAALGQKPSNFIVNWSEGASTSQEKQVKAQDPQLDVTKNSRIVPSKLFYDLLKKDETGKLDKTADGAWQPKDLAALEELKDRLANQYNLKRDSIIDYNEMMATPQKNNIKKWNVIIAPGEGDISANRQDVLSTLLLKH